MQRQRPVLTPIKSSPQLGKYPQGAAPPPKPAPLVAPPAPKRPKTRAGSADAPDDHYIEVPAELFCHVPARAHIIYKKIGDVSGVFYGGFVKSHHKTATGYMTLISYGLGDKATTYPLAHDEIEKMWKKYYEPAFIELYMSRNALVRRRVDVEDLAKRVKQLEATVLNLRRV